MAGVARVGDLRVGPAQSLRLRAHRPRRRPHGDAHPRAGRPASRRGAHAGVGHRAAARAVAASLVSPDDAARRLLDRAGRRAGPAGAGRRRLDGPHGRRSTAPSAIATCRSSSASGPRCSWRSTSSVGCGSASWPGRRSAGWRPRADAALPASRHCERTPAVALWRRRACDDASRTGPGRALLQRGGPPRPARRSCSSSRRTRACSSCWSTMGVSTARGRSSSACARRRLRR